MSHRRIIVTSIYVVTPWRRIFDWTVTAILAFIIAVALVAALDPLYDIAKWHGWL